MTENRTGLVLGWTIPMLLLMLLFVFSRFIFKIVSKSKLGITA
jgi:hypothetical protein